MIIWKYILHLAESGNNKNDCNKLKKKYFKMSNAPCSESCVAIKMKDIIVILVVATIISSCAADAILFKVDDSKIGVKHRRANGTIFNNTYPFSNFFVSDADSTKRWTPSKRHIELAEKILKEQIKKLNKNRINQMENCPVIHRHLYAYFRQYVGIINDRGQRIIHINFYWNKYGLIDRIKGYHDLRLDFDSDYAIVMDGCSYYWQINVNLDEKKLSDLMINGIA